MFTLGYRCINVAPTTENATNLVVYEEDDIDVLDGGVVAQDCVVRLHDGCGDLEAVFA